MGLRMAGNALLAFVVGGVLERSYRRRRTRRRALVKHSLITILLALRAAAAHADSQWITVSEDAENRYALDPDTAKVERAVSPDHIAEAIGAILNKRTGAIDMAEFVVGVPDCKRGHGNLGVYQPQQGGRFITSMPFRFGGARHADMLAERVCAPVRALRGPLTKTSIIQTAGFSGRSLTNVATDAPEGRLRSG